MNPSKKMALSGIGRLERAIGSVGLMLAPWMSSIEAASITATLRNLADVVPGEDRWEAEYLISGYSFGLGEGFTIFFSFSGYSNLETPALPAHPGWDLLLIQPERVPVGLDGLHDGLASVANPPVGDPFVVRFDWDGAGRPGSQLFEIYLVDPFAVLEEGNTSVVYGPPDPGVPDAGATHLPLGIGVTMLFAWARWGRRARAGGEWALAQVTGR